MFAKSHIIFAAMSLMTTGTVPADFTVETDFPGGNALVERIAEDTIHLAPDNRDSAPWFYWNVAVKGAAGRTLNFVLNPMHIGAHGPAVSLDGGVTWKWLGADAVKDGAFSYVFPANVDDVRLSVGMPYVSAHLDKFLAAHAGNPLLRREALTKSGKGRDVPLLLLGNPERKAPFAVAVLARNHASEMMGSYVLEGMLAGFFAEDDQGQWLRDNVDFFVAPFADMDGVEDGDQGKGRKPHDHNRDYGDNPIYAEVAAIKEQLPAWSAGRPMVFFDIHNPALKGDVHEVLQFLEGPNEAQKAEQTRFLELLEREQQGNIIVKSTMVMKFGSGYNRISGEPPPHAAGWARTVPGALFAVTLEMPYANAQGFEVNADSAREFGRDIAWGLQAYLKELQEKKTP